MSNIRAGRGEGPPTPFTLPIGRGCPWQCPSVAGNHNDLYDIEVQFEVVTAALDRAEIPMEGIFLNADAGFDSKDFRAACASREINANICFNKRNGNTERNEYFDQKLYAERYAVELTNA